MVDGLITNIMLPEIGREFLASFAAGCEVKRVHVTLKDGKFLLAFDQLNSPEDEPLKAR